MTSRGGNISTPSAVSLDTTLAPLKFPLSVDERVAFIVKTLSISIPAVGGAGGSASDSTYPMSGAGTAKALTAAGGAAAPT